MLCSPPPPSQLCYREEANIIIFSSSGCYGQLLILQHRKSGHKTSYCNIDLRWKATFRSENSQSSMQACSSQDMYSSRLRRCPQLVSHLSHKKDSRRSSKFRSYSAVWITVDGTQYAASRRFDTIVAILKIHTESHHHHSWVQT